MQPDSLAPRQFVRASTQPETPAESAPPIDALAGQPELPATTVLVTFSVANGGRASAHIPEEMAERIRSEIAAFADAASDLGSGAIHAVVRPNGRPAKARFGTVTMDTPQGRRSFLFGSMKELAALLGTAYPNIANAYLKHCRNSGLCPDSHNGIIFEYAGKTVQLRVRD